MSMETLPQKTTPESFVADTNNDDTVYNSEVQSDTEEYYEYFEINGQQFRQKMTKRRVVEKIKCQQTVFAPLMSDGTGPDLTKMCIHDHEDQSINRPDQLCTNMDNPDPGTLPAFQRFTQDRFRVSGSRFRPRQVDIEVPAIIFEVDPKDSQIEKLPSPMTNYMFRCGQSEFEVPIVDTQMSTQLRDAVNSEWFKTNEIDLPHEKSKSISYFKKSFQKNDNGSAVYNMIEKTKSRTLRMKLDGKGQQPSATCYPLTKVLEITNSGADSANEHCLVTCLSSDVLYSHNKDRNDLNDDVSKDSTPAPIIVNSSANSMENVPESKDVLSNKKNGATGIENEDNYSFILREDNQRPYLIFDDDAKHGECDIAGGPVDALIVHACDGKEHVMFLGAFLDTYRTFVGPEALIDRLIFRYRFFRSKMSLNGASGSCYDKNDASSNGSSPSMSPEDNPEKKCIHILSLLLTIIGKLKRDFTDNIKVKIQHFQQYLLDQGEEHWTCTIRNTIQTLQDSVNRDHEMVALLSQLSSTSPSAFSTKSRAEVIGNRGTIFDFSSREIAEQMTLLDWAKYRDVELNEVLNLKDIANCKLPGVIEYAKHFQNVQHWAQSIFLDPDKRTSDRDKFYWKFYRIMKHLRALNNFSSYIALLLAIQLLPIKKLFSKKIRTKIIEMEDYMRPTRFVGYKEDLKHATAPCIPFLGLFYQDIVMLNIANPQYLDLEEVALASTNSNWTSNNNHQLLGSITSQCGPVINFWRSFKQYLFLKNCNKDQDKIRYPIKTNEQILKFLDNFQHRYNEETLQKLAKCA